ncbi:MAG: glucosaminidase domain-containing protein [archaeon]|nr:glucosaminidase domain-containing protein [archaeon]
MIAPIVIEENNRREKHVLPSVCIAQACLESGFGSSKLMMKANAIFGIKATKSWTGKVFNSKTNECYDGVNYTEIEASFRAYNNISESIADYYNLITGLDRYSKAVNENDFVKCITAIKEGGYATSPSYIDSIVSLINTYNLTKYDNGTNIVDSGTNIVDSGTVKKSNEEIAQEVIDMKWDVYPKRKELLENAGYDYQTIQNIVNERNYVYYTVKIGDSLWKISLKYYGTGTKYTYIKELNNLKSNIIFPGQKLRVK